jgi:UDP-2-acetamido-2,6-beta-L-arabino-hexul-4-ose reductase
MNKLKVGITGQSGFIGYHLFDYLRQKADRIELVPFEDDFFTHAEVMEKFVSECDTIVHLAAMNRGNDAELYNTNVHLVQTLISALKRTGKSVHLLHASSIQENRDNPYGRSKRDGDKLFQSWATESGSRQTTFVIPNVFGAFGKPFYNSVISTFCFQLTHNQKPEIRIDAELPLIYVNDLVEVIYDGIIAQTGEKIQSVKVKETDVYKVSELLEILKGFQRQYINDGIIPELMTMFDIALFNTFRSYLDYSYFPKKLEIRSDERGYLFEQIRSMCGGQTFFSLTHPGITRGNHYHVRKFERFCVVSGDATIRFRKIGSKEIIEYHVSGENPVYVDIPIFHTHNIENTGNSSLLTLFWSNEFYNPENSDTIFERV